MISNEQLSRRLGLAVSEPIANQLSVSDFIDDHLSRPPSKLAVKTHADPFDAAEPLPKKLQYNLWRRAGFNQKWWKEFRKAQKIGTEAAQNVFWNKYLHLLKSREDEKNFTNHAIFSKDHINYRLSHFWLNHFTVGYVGDNDTFIFNYWEEVIYKGLNGKFKDILYQCITHPAMLAYLDNTVNRGENSQAAKDCKRDNCVVGLNDNLARELLELHTVTPSKGYTENDIKNAAKILAGWGNSFGGEHADFRDYSQPWYPYHAEPGNKVVLGLRVGAGERALRKLTDFLAEDDATINHLSSKLLAHFTTNSAKSDVEAVAKVWRQTDGALPAIHRKVLEIAARSTVSNSPWPLTWGIRLCRMSRSNLFLGFDEDHDMRSPLQARAPHLIWPEIGMSFWSVRQPDGFSQDPSDWISTEYFDRRLRFADMVYTHGNPELGVDEIMDTQGVSTHTIELVSQGNSDREKFILFMCSPEMMEA